MRWERVKLKMKLKEIQPLEGRKSPGRKGGILGPGKRWGHTCNSIKGGRFLYVFGGYGKDNCQTNDVHVFDTLKQTWSKPMVKGIPPSPRDSHSCTTVGNNLFVFGGTDGKNPLKDLHILDTITNTWMQPNLVGDGPDAREGHSAALIDKRLFIFGGCGKSRNEPEEVYYNDLYILDTESFTWKRAVTSGIPPSARDSHTCSSWRNKIIVLGGEDASDYYLSDVHILDADTLVWRELNTSGQMLAPRAGHATVALGKKLFVFGGFTDDRNLYDDLHVLDAETGVWNKISNVGQGPSSRFSVAGDCLDPRKGVLVFIGGCNENLEALDDMFYLYTDMSSENGRGDQRPEKFSLRKELKRKRQQQYLPSSGSEKDKDVRKVELTPDSYPLMSPPMFSQAAMGKASLFEVKPPEEKIFEAKITDIFRYGYNIETNIDGKPLRGILFSYEPNFSHAAHAYLSRKKIAGEAGAKLNDVHKPKLKISRAAKQAMKQSDQKKAADASPVSRTPTQESPGVALASHPHTSAPSNEPPQRHTQTPETAGPTPAPQKESEHNATQAETLPPPSDQTKISDQHPVIEAHGEEKSSQPSLP
ncbi:acyl-CoA-binding domain-containing protein 4 isoform X1 [Amborella trichopoda]|uniref:DCD domain-containing protein n=1 Tax=Amborella trichopoda TaxID=13333 RepID=U5D6N5_AMBTC|nr:acyl-CoA-binding domain-containing protein 4 isoform X1 [Amborella trichopoda]XP_020530471.1 acyl-CoA-binding domain-containing protein 4 isoform X1 [Amborella trichopoda]XP_020530472.1 acyl-CoA-binding domain-containing protein 4 isoform X1 [Amborella trichopoda]XP_020530473.1 acyl-CoA-binding domain-containing protein 4 isoform X1 [Amborella trichopoda]XP_020530474.1 acyl-CoA-binding domain-containing protein 4 isoform X1 [Amborella trichopoda]XP_020530475.1 acyl-CoA-binding domain-contai|eukprot:XP_006856448.3 acyl-CoA-binding domain-containing protein 4 isoform X1 [Amborella trichopoda]